MQIWVRLLGAVAIGTAFAVRTGERRIIDALELAGAVTPETATKLPLTSFLRKMIFRRLLNVGAVGETMMQLQYLDVPGYAAFQSRRRRRAFIVIPLILALGLYSYFRQR